MKLGPFDLIEMITLLFNVVSFMFIYNAYKENINIPLTKKLWTYFLLVALLVLLNRIFTNVEALFLQSFFNIIEHLSTLAASIIFIFAARYALKGD